MKKILDFVKKYGQLIIIIMLSLVLMKSCGIKNECLRNRKEISELTKEVNKKDSIIDNNLKELNHKIDSTLISNSAVVNSNKATSNAINNQKQIVVKVVPTK